MDGERQLVTTVMKDSRRSIADVVNEDTLLEVRAFKKQQKAAAKAAKK